MIVNRVGARGDLVLVLRDPAGRVIAGRRAANLVVASGLALVTSRLVDASQSVVSHMALGSDETAADQDQTALLAETGRVALQSLSRVTTSKANDSVQHVAVFPAGVCTGALREAGLFNSGSSGAMMCRSTFGVINKGAGDSLTVTWKVAFAPA
jgi:hypothetical protein